jgi:hypothetical protein
LAHLLQGLIDQRLSGQGPVWQVIVWQALLRQGFVWLWCAALLPAADFSHQLHVQLKPDCTACHTAARSSTAVSDNLFPKAEACTACHQEVSIRQPRPLRVAVFDHARHLKLGNVAPVLKAAVQSKSYLGEPGEMLKWLDSKNECLACHRGIQESKVIRADSSQHFPHMADCLVCHNKIDPPFSCETCHLNDKTLKPAFHTPDYLDVHTKRSAKEGCAVCHGRKFTCLGCH